MDKQVIEHFIEKSAEGSYYTIPFTVPGGVERITVSYSYKRARGKIGRPSDMVNIVDMGLCDGKGRFLGWSGSSRSSVFVGPHSATSGYLMAEIAPGQWSIIVGAYKIPLEGLAVRYEISFTPKSPRWLCGDLHTHSTASDGACTIGELTQMALREGLDFLAVSNHNNYSENFSLPSVAGLTLIPAVEWTHYKGHMNFFGAPAPFENSFVANSEGEMLALVEKAKQMGALISVNHPKCHLCPYTWQSQDCFDTVEVWNGPMRPANLRAIEWWHKMQVRGRRIPLVGGSDFHKPRALVRFARPVTWVLSDSPSPEDILSAIKSGTSFVSASPKGVRLDLTCGRAMMGGSVKISGGERLAITASGLRRGMTVNLVAAQGTVRRWHGRARLCEQVEIDPAWRFAYLTVTRETPGMPLVRAISNPIYFDKEG